MNKQAKDAYEEWCKPRMSSFDQDHPSDAFVAGWEAALSHAAGQDGEQCRAASGNADFAKMDAVYNFLMGISDLGGVSFGERHPMVRGQFWWRHDLAAAYASIRALSRGVPEGKIVAYRLHTPDNRWQWMDGTPPLGTLDLWKSYGWKLEYAYAGPDHAAIAAQRKEG